MLARSAQKQSENDCNVLVTVTGTVTGQGNRSKAICEFDGCQAILRSLVTSLACRAMQLCMHFTRILTPTSPLLLHAISGRFVAPVLMGMAATILRTNKRPQQHAQNS